MNVEELLTKKGIPLAYQGGDFLVTCLNPEHPDRHPSMRIDKISGIFNCFSCKFKGNIFTHFGEAVNALQMRRELLKKKIVEKLSETIGVPFPKNYTPYLGAWRGISTETYKEFEAFQHHDNEYAGRIMFPIRSISGNIVGFNGRHTTGGMPKYIFTPPGIKIPLFPIVKPINGAVIVVEGIFDMLNLYDKGISNSVCCFGTKNINIDKLNMLRIQGVDSINIFFDGDEAGQEGATNLKNLCDEIGLTSRNIYIKGTDPGGLTLEQVQKLREKL